MRWQTAYLTLSGLVAATMFGAALLQPTRRTDDFQQPRQASVDQTAAAPAEVQKITRLMTPNDAVCAALADLQTVPISSRRYIRYLWSQEGGKKVMRTVSLGVNYSSQASGIIRVLPVAGGYLLRADLRLYDPQHDGDDWRRYWEELQYDPAFSRLITRDAVQFERQRIERRIEWRTEERDVMHAGGRFDFPDDSGRFRADLPAGKYRLSGDDALRFKVVVDQPALEVKDVVRFNCPSIDPLPFEALQAETHSLAPVVDYRYAQARMLKTIKQPFGKKDNELTPSERIYKTVWGGLYYEFRGIRKAKDVLGKDTKATDLDLFFEDSGIGNIKGGLTADALFDKLTSDQQLAIRRSGITGKVRDILGFNTPAAPERPWSAISGDVGDSDVDVGDDPFMNLLNPRRKAREAIFRGANGLEKTSLFNGAGERQDEVPSDVANDHGIPSPHTQRLDGILGCAHCHGPHDWWQPLRNDVSKSLSRRPGADIFDDFGGRFRYRSEVLNRLVGKYEADFTQNLQDARDASWKAHLRAMGPWTKDESDLPHRDAAKIGTEWLWDSHKRYWYDEVDAQVALRELGWEVPASRALAVMAVILPPDLRNVDEVDDTPFVPEDARQVSLNSGLGISRTSWGLYRSFAAERARRVPKEVVEKLLRN